MIKTSPNLIEKFKINQKRLILNQNCSKFIKKSKYIDFSISFNIFNLLIDNFDLLINHFQSNFHSKIENRSKLINFIKNRSKLYRNCDCRLKSVVGFRIGPISTIEFGIQIGSNDDELIWDGTWPKLTQQGEILPQHFKL